ncbi:hypothetical protein [Symbiopectobacterium purcellii]|uniref:hypothetical protein n=1 Tax=Symbiopectobacterium purcellii TaxID=2871826 RepID=UPI003F86FEDC
MMIPSYSLAPVFGISISEQHKIYFNHRNTLISLLSNTLNAFYPLEPHIQNFIRQALSTHSSPEIIAKRLNFDYII